MPLTVLRRGAPWLLAALCAGLLAACGSSTPLSPEPAPQVAVAPASSVPGATPAPAVVAVRVSAANTPRAYRKDAASHLYVLNSERIYKGRLPPMLYAIGVMQVDVDRQGQVRSFSWMRAPKHAPEVMAEIERTVRAAAPFPVPARMGRVVYTDTWLWDKSGRFQLDTLTEGQD
jgi:protein TonB